MKSSRESLLSAFITFRDGGFHYLYSYGNSIAVAAPSVVAGDIDHALWPSISEFGREVGRGHLPPLHLGLHRLLRGCRRLVRAGRRLQRGSGPYGRARLLRSLAPILARVVPRIRRHVPHARSIFLDLVPQDLAVATTHKSAARYISARILY